MFAYDPEYPFKHHCVIEFVIENQLARVDLTELNSTNREKTKNCTHVFMQLVFHYNSFPKFHFFFLEIHILIEIKFNPSKFCIIQKLILSTRGSIRIFCVYIYNEWRC